MSFFKTVYRVWVKINTQSLFKLINFDESLIFVVIKQWININYIKNEYFVLKYFIKLQAEKNLKMNNNYIIRNCLVINL